MKTTGAVITDIVEAMDKRRGTWVRIAELNETIGADIETLTEALSELMEMDSFQVEPEPFGHRVTAAERANPIMIGGEARHKVRWDR